MGTLMQGGWDRVFGRDSWWAEFWSACTAVLWAGLSYAGNERLQDWPGMRVLIELGDARFWHLLAFGVGFAQLVAVAGERRWLRWSIALIQGWFWGVLSVGVWAATPWSPAVAVHAGWCAINVFAVVQSLRRSRHAGGV